MLVGLQGSGKTTTAAKLAKYLEKNNKKKSLMVSLDVYRPAAQEQLSETQEQIDKIKVAISSESGDPIKNQSTLKGLSDTFSQKKHEILTISLGLKEQIFYSCVTCVLCRKL